MPKGDTTSNVIDVDFTPRLTPEMALDVLDELADLRREIDAMDVEERRWRQWEYRQLSRRLREAREQLRLERANQFTDDDVQAVLIAVGRDPVAASAVARTLLPNEPTHSAVVRVALALSRLAEDGKAIRIGPHDPRRETCRWQAVQDA